MKNRLLKPILVLFAVFTISSLNLAASELNQGIIKEDTLAYTSPMTDAEPSDYVNAGEEIVIADETDSFYGIFNKNYEVVYIEKTYIQVQNSEIKDESIQSTKGEEVINYAKQFIGLSYRSGGANLQTGVDCAGFTQQIYKNFNINLQRSSRDQYALNGNKVTKAELIPGDLVFYGVSGRVRHVAIYVGNDQIIHAPVPGKSVCIVPMQQRGNDPIIGYRRVI